MTDVVRWLIAVEVIGVAFLPVTMWLLHRLPDRGYIFAKILGLLLVTYCTWLVGEVVPVARSVLLPAIVLLAGGTLGWWLRWQETWQELQRAGRTVFVQEGLFLAGVIGWSLLRAFVLHPAIAHTEQFMDMAFLNASLRSASYPPYDPWMSGHSINYYYFGYLTFATLIKLAVVAPSVGYNLALSTLFAFTVAGAYSLGYALTRHYLWAALGPLFVALIGNWHAIFLQIPQNHLPGNSNWWFWDSTRVVSGPNDYTINEFPLFSFILGDLHPHVMALPVTLLAIACAGSVVFAKESLRLDWDRTSLGRLALMAVCLGSLYATNSWDFPTYLLVVCAGIVVNGYLTDLTSNWWKAPARVIPALALTSVVAFTPFYLQFKSLAHGIGPVTTRTDPLEFLQVFGFFFLGAGLLVMALGALLRPTDEDQETVDRGEHTESTPAVGLLSERGAGTPTWLLGLCVFAVALVGIVSHSITLLLILALGTGALLVLHRVVNSEEPNRSDAFALALVACACFVLALTEILYIRDAFDGSASYRMNTVFKFYYQSWTMLGLASAYGAYRAWYVIRRLFAARYALAAAGALLLGTLGGGAYTALAVSSPIDNDGVYGLDGMAWVQHQFPGDYGVIQWLRGHAGGNQVLLEAAGGGYTDYGLISTFSGVPSVIQWADHEGQWRPGNGEVEVRVGDVRTMYTSGDVALAERLLRTYKVHYVVVGEHERSEYAANPQGLAKFARFMRVAYQTAGATLYYW